MIQRTPIKRGSPPRKRRPGKPRRGRMVNEAFMRMVRARGCILVGRRDHMCFGGMTFHHVRAFGSPKNDEIGLGLCSDGHLAGYSAVSIESLGKEKFEAYWSVSIADEVAANVAAWAELQARGSDSTPAKPQRIEARGVSA